MLMPQTDAGVIARRAEIIAELKRIVPGDGVIAEQEALRAYECDGLTAYRQLPMIVVLPETAHRYAAYLGPQAEAIMLKGEDHRLNSEAALARITQAIGEISTKVGFVPQPPVANDPGTGPTRKPVVDATPRPRR